MPEDVSVRSYTRGNPYTYFKNLKVNRSGSITNIASARTRAPTNIWSGASTKISIGRVGSYSSRTDDAERVEKMFKMGAENRQILTSEVDDAETVLSPQSDRYYLIYETLLGEFIGAFLLNPRDNQITKFVLKPSQTNIKNLKRIYWLMLKEVATTLTGNFVMLLFIDNAINALKKKVAKQVGFTQSSMEGTTIVLRRNLDNLATRTVTSATSVGREDVVV